MSYIMIVLVNHRVSCNCSFGVMTCSVPSATLRRIGIVRVSKRLFIQALHVWHTGTTNSRIAPKLVPIQMGLVPQSRSIQRGTTCSSVNGRRSSHRGHVPIFDGTGSLLGSCDFDVLCPSLSQAGIQKPLHNER